MSEASRSRRDYTGGSVARMTRELREQMYGQLIDHLQKARQLEWEAEQGGRGIKGWEALDQLCGWAIDRSRERS